MKEGSGTLQKENRPCPPRPPPPVTAQPAGRGACPLTPQHLPRLCQSGGSGTSPAQPETPSPALLCHATLLSLACRQPLSPTVMWASTQSPLPHPPSLPALQAAEIPPYLPVLPSISRWEKPRFWFAPVTHTQASSVCSQLHPSPGAALPSSRLSRWPQVLPGPHIPPPPQIAVSCQGFSPTQVSLDCFAVLIGVHNTFHLISSANFINGLFTPSLRIINEDVR